jgi:ZIP family zinc transporter
VQFYDCALTETDTHMALLITFLLGLFIVLGAAITVFSHDHHHVEQFSVALAFGALATLALADLLPEALEHLGESSATPILIIICMAVGIGVLKVIDHFVPDHDNKQLATDHNCSENNVMHIGIMTTVAVSLHNLIEGMTVYSVAAESLQSGLLIALGVGLHNIPMGMVIFSTLQSEPRGKRIALMACACLSTFVGGLAMNCLWFAIDDFQVGLLIALTLGMIAYLVIFELLPHLMHTHNKKLAAAGVIIGVAVVLVSVSLG